MDRLPGKLPRPTPRRAHTSCVMGWGAGMAGLAGLSLQRLLSCTVLSRAQAIPEIGDYSLRLKQKKVEPKSYPVPDEIIALAQGAGSATSLDRRQQKYGGFQTPAGSGYQTPMGRGWQTPMGRGWKTPIGGNQSIIGNLSGLSQARAPSHATQHTTRGAPRFPTCSGAVRSVERDPRLPPSSRGRFVVSSLCQWWRLRANISPMCSLRAGSRAAALNEA